MNTKVKKTLVIVRDLVTVALLVIFIVALLPLLPINDVPKFYAVVSGSMEPKIKTGALVLSVPVNPKHVAVNDIVVFDSPYNSKDIVVHRIIGIKSQEPLRFASKGDNNPSADNWDVMGSSIKGKYFFSIPYIGKLSLFIRKPLGFAIVILIPALVLVILQILDIKNAINDEIEKRLKKKIEDAKNPITKLFSIILLFGVLGFLFATNKTYALLSDKAKIKGLSLTVATKYEDDDEDDIHHNRCPKRFTRYFKCKIPKDFRNPFDKDPKDKDKDWKDNDRDDEHTFNDSHDSTEKYDEKKDEKRDMEKYDDLHYRETQNGDNKDDVTEEILENSHDYNQETSSTPTL